MDVGSWDTSIHHETTLRILKNAYESMPELSKGQGWEKIEIVSSNVGLRPARRGGARMELEEVKVKKGGPERKVGVVHACEFFLPVSGKLELIPREKPN